MDFDGTGRNSFGGNHNDAFDENETSDCDNIGVKMDKDNKSVQIYIDRDMMDENSVSKSPNSKMREGSVKKNGDQINDDRTESSTKYVKELSTVDDAMEYYNKVVDNNSFCMEECGTGKFEETGKGNNGDGKNNSHRTSSSNEGYETDEKVSKIVFRYKSMQEINRILKNKLIESTDVSIHRINLALCLCKK